MSDRTETTPVTAGRNAVLRHEPAGPALADPGSDRPAAARLTRKGMTVFLDALAETGMVRAAAARAGIPRGALYRRRSADAAFAAAWADALDASLDGLRDEAVRRAFEGEEQPVWYRGAVVGSVRQYSDALLIYLLLTGGDARRAPPPPVIDAPPHRAGLPELARFLQDASADDLCDLMEKIGYHPDLIAEIVSDTDGAAD